MVGFQTGIGVPVAFLGNEASEEQEGGAVGTQTVMMISDGEVEVTGLEIAGPSLLEGVMMIG